MTTLSIAGSTLAVALLSATPAEAQTGRPWIRTYDSPVHGIDTAVAVALGSHGDVLVAGSSPTALDSDLYVLAFDADGIPKWSRAIDAGGAEYGAAVAFDETSGAVYALGNQTGVAGAYAGFVLARLDPGSGAVVWQTLFRGPTLQGARGSTLTVDPAGGIVVGGTLGADISGAALVAHFDANGAETWTWSNPARSNVAQVAAAPNGDLALQQRSYSTTGGPMRTISRLAQGGTELWSRDVGATENGCFGPVFDSHSNVLYSINVPLVGGRVIAKLDATGNPMWSVDAVAIFGINTSTYGLVVGREDQVYAAGSSGQIVRLNPTGGVVWTAALPPSAWFDVGGYGGLALAPNGDVVMRTQGHVLPDLEDFDSVATWSPDGAFRWSQAIRAPDPDQDLNTYGLTVTRDGAVVVAGVAGTSPVADIVVAAIRPRTATFCLGDGSAGTCPCGNSPFAIGGCRRGGSATGARLDDQGIASLSTDTLRFFGSYLPNTASCVLLQGNPAASGIPFQDGLLCLTSPLARIHVGSASSTFADFLPSGSPSISARSATLGHPIAPGTRLGYQIYYRGSSFCAPGNANLTNGIVVDWSL